MYIQLAPEINYGIPVKRSECPVDSLSQDLTKIKSGTSHIPITYHTSHIAYKGLLNFIHQNCGTLKQFPKTDPEVSQICVDENHCIKKQTPM